ncbi:MAG: hypothetical protein FIA82_10095 [Melioribacter sp.]|nr:hypothetical protein [Melioribacter sp.]
MSNKFEEDLSKLIELGSDMLDDLRIPWDDGKKEIEAKIKKMGIDKKEAEEVLKRIKGSFQDNYHRWFSEAYALIKIVLPDRLEEFDSLYKQNPRRKTIDSLSYSIQDWMLGIRADKNDFTGEKSFNDYASIVMRFQNQYQIVKTARSRFQSSLFDIKQITQADLFDSEIHAAQALLKNGFLRPAGVIAGVILEKHLSNVCNNHKLQAKKKDPTISDFNDLLKNADVIDTPLWRQIQRLGDIRNLSSHNKGREPSKDEIIELINGTDKIMKTLF